MTDADISSSGAKPTIIDLNAEQVIDDSVETAARDTHPAPAPARKRSWRLLASLAAIAAAVVAGAWLYKDFLSGYFPSDAMQAATARIEVLEAQSKTLNDQLTALANQSEELRVLTANASKQSDEALAAAKDMAARTASSGAQLAATENSVAELKSALAALQNAPAQSQGSDGNSGPALAALARRVDEVEKQLASLKAAKPPSGLAERNAALSQALSDLKAKIAAGASYQREYDRIASLVPAAAGLDSLAARAAEGLPTASGLAQELRAQISNLPRPAAETPTEDGYLSRFWNALDGIITIRKVGETDWPTVASHAADLADSGDLAGAIKLLDAAEGEKPVTISQWRERAAARLALESTLAETDAAVLRQLAGPSP